MALLVQCLCWVQPLRLCGQELLSCTEVMQAQPQQLLLGVVGVAR